MNTPSEEENIETILANLVSGYSRQDMSIQVVDQIEYAQFLLAFSLVDRTYIRTLSYREIMKWRSRDCLAERIASICQQMTLMFDSPKYQEEILAHHERFLRRQQEFARDIEILTPRQAYPKTCSGCKHLHGQNYSGQLLVCAIHPYGPDGDRCDDFFDGCDPAQKT